MTGKIVLSVTGGATKFIQLLIAIYKILQRGYKPTDIIVMSSSAIMIVLILLGKFEELYQEAIELNLKKYFKIPPTDGKGNLTILARLRAVWSFLPDWLGGKVNSFGEQDVRPLLKKYLTEELFNKYKTGDYPNVWVVSVKPSKAKQKEYVSFVNLKDCTFHEALDEIEASSRIQVFTNSLKVKGEWRNDGGMYFAGAAGWAIEENIEDFANTEQLVSIYSYTDPHFGIKEGQAWRSNIGNNSARVSELLKASNKYYCRLHEHYLCKDRGIKRLEVDVPDIMENTYQYDKKTVYKASFETTEYMNELLIENSSFFEK